MSEINLVGESKDMLTFDSPKGQSSIIKVIGVGGGGNNAVDHMYRLGIIGVDFINCNTDLQVLEASPVPHVIHFGTSGTGAGSNPEVGRKLAEESIGKIESLLEKSTKMVFIIAGMGGGTGTGAAPVVAATAKRMGILTVAIVTEPFEMEGQRRMEQAQRGIEQLKKFADVLLVIKNEKLLEQYGKLKLTEAYHKVDDVMANAAKSIAEIITVRGYVNVDFEDVKTVMSDSGTAIMGIGVAQGEDRAVLVVEEALNSPLLNNIDIRGSKELLIYITYGDNEIDMEEMRDITELVHERTGNNAHLILGHGYDERLGDNISVSIIATGFGMPDIPGKPPVPRDDHFEKENPEQSGQSGITKENKILIPFDGEKVPDPETEPSVPEPVTVVENQETTTDAEDIISGIQLVTKDDQPEAELPSEEEVKETPIFAQEPVTVHQLIPEPNIPLTPAPARTQESWTVIVNEEDDEDFSISEQPNYATHFQSGISPVAVRPVAQGTTVYPKTETDPSDNLTKNRVNKLRLFSKPFSPSGISETVMEEPAYKRRNIQFEPVNHSSETHVSNYNIFPDEDGKLVFQQNQYLHDNVD